MERSYEVAEIEVGDVWVSVIFVDRRMEAGELVEVRRRAAEQGLRGDVVVVWADEYGRTRFIAAPEMHRFFRVAGWGQLRAQVNGRLG